MTEQKYAPSLKGALFDNRGKGNSKSQYGGSVSISVEDLQSLLFYAKESGNAEDGVISFYVNGYERTSKNGNDYISLIIGPGQKAYREFEEQAGIAEDPF